MTDNINLIACINQLGYGIAGTNIATALSKLSNVALWPISFEGNYLSALRAQLDIHPKYREEINKCVSNIMTYDYFAPCIRIYHQFDLAQFVGVGPHIGFPIFELDTFTQAEIHHQNGCDYLFVCSEDARQIQLNNNIKSDNKIFVIPLGVDSSLFKPVEVKHSEQVVFLNIGKWEVRKGHDILPHLMKDALGDKDYVLIMCNHNPFYSQEENEQWIRYYQNLLGDKVKFVNRLNTQEEVCQLMNMADVGIFPTRAEGWNLEALELMACGRKSILLNYLGHKEFCTPDNSYLVQPLDGLTTSYDGKWFFGQGNWLNIGPSTREALVEKIREAYNAGKASVDDNCIATAKRFSWTNTANTIINTLGNLS